LSVFIGKSQAAFFTKRGISKDIIDAKGRGSNQSIGRGDKALFIVNIADIIALFTLLRYQQVLPTKGLSPLPIPHSDENCYIYSPFCMSASPDM
jgi:hypothetical protein